MIRINKKSDCCGCAACYSVCPQKCINMVPDKEGFLYPIVDETSCINCGLCESVCPVFNRKNHIEEFSEAYVFQIQDECVLKRSASGGFTAAIAKYIIEQNGFMGGAIFDEENVVRHKMYSSSRDCEKFSGSKYVQSDIGECYLEVQSLLKKGKLVCFSGTPCQIEGLTFFLGKNYINLILIDVLCAGVPSPKLWKEYLSWHEKKNNKVLKVNFRNKTYGYQCSTMLLNFENGEIYSQSGRTDPMMKLFLSGIAKRPICYECPFKKLHRVSDFTIFDGWHAESFKGVKNDERGYTILIVHTQKGKEILNKLKDSYFVRVDMKRAVELDGIMAYKKTYKHPSRDEFYRYLDNNGIEKTISKFMPISHKDIFIENLKPVLYKVGLIKMMKKIRQHIEK